MGKSEYKFILGSHQRAKGRFRRPPGVRSGAVLAAILCNTVENLGKEFTGGGDNLHVTHRDHEYFSDYMTALRGAPRRRLRKDTFVHQEGIALVIHRGSQICFTYI